MCQITECIISIKQKLLELERGTDCNGCIIKNEMFFSLRVTLGNRQRNGVSYNVIN